MPLVKFTESARSYRPKVSVRQNGTIGFNYGAVRKWKLDTFPCVALFFDKDTRAMGIKPTTVEEEGAHKLNFGRGNKSAWVSCRKFFDYFDISIPATRRFDARWEDKEQMILLNL